MRYMVFDLETEPRVCMKRKASPWHPENYVVLRAWKCQGDKQCSWEYYKDNNTETLRIPDDVKLLVGFNIKFDLLWEMRLGNQDLKDFFRRGGSIWDCQYAEYLLQAQHPDSQMCSLDSIVQGYGGTLKPDEVKRLWETGLLTSEIPEDLLVDYSVGTAEEGRNGGDIGNTEKVFLGQVKKAVRLGMVPAIKARMDGLCCTTEMEFNGLKIDLEEAHRRMHVLEDELRKVTEELNSFVPALPTGLDFNWQSRVHVSCLTFGGTIGYNYRTTYIDPNTGELARKTETQDWPLFNGVTLNPAKCTMGEDNTYCMGVLRQDVFLSGAKKGTAKFKKVQVPGELKTKLQAFSTQLSGYTVPKPEWRTEQTDAAGSPVYSTGDDVIQELAKSGVPFCEALGRHASLCKELGTYYSRYDPKKKAQQGMLTCVGPDGIIHHKLNHTSTVTTRLSSSDPNLQNIPRGDKSELKKVFLSRFDDGVMIEADYSQLEVVILALLSLDPHMCADLINKVDFHCKRVAAKYGCTYEEALLWCKTETAPDHKLWKGRRTACKIFSFQLQYGAGAGTISETTGLSVDDVKAMISNENAMYPGVHAFNTAVQKIVESTAEPFKDPQRGWRVFRRGYYTAPTGCRYSFRSWDAPKFMRERGVSDTFSPPELKNYPVQGTGGEVVQIILGCLWRRFVETDNYGGNALLVNTVHDCVWVDCAKEVLRVVADDVRRIMQSIPEELKRRFNMEVPVPFPVEVEAGPNMYTLAHV